MIKAEELRLNNLVEFNGIMGYVDWVQPDSVTLNYLKRQEDLCNGAFVHPESLTPISLTEEWLLKFGFEKKFVNYPSFDYEDYRIGNCVATIIESGVEIEFDGLNIVDRTYIREINYVHQLQNLYFALTGEELTLKSND